MRNFNPDHKFGTRSPGRFRDDAPKRFSRRDSPSSEGKDSVGRDFRGRDTDRFLRRDSERSFEKNMYLVTCAKCGDRCEVPFRPREGKPIYCRHCFRKDDPDESKSQVPSRSEFILINKKLDKIMKVLDVEL